MKNIFLNAASYSIRLELCIWLEIPEERQSCKIVPDNNMLHYGRYLINAKYIHPQAMARLDNQRPLGAVQNWGPPSLHIFDIWTQKLIFTYKIFFCFGKDISHLSVVKILTQCKE
jgi:hypothetical protein